MLLLATTGWLKRHKPSIWLFVILAVAPVLSLILIIPRDTLEMLTLKRELQKSELRRRINGDEAETKASDQEDSIDVDSFALMR